MDLGVILMKTHAIDFVEALKRPFSDTKKLLIGTILGIIPIVNFTVIGYTLTSTGFTKEEVNKESLPEWENYVDLFMKGLVSVIIGIILFLPAALVLFGTLGTVIIAPAVNMILGGLPIETYNDLISGQVTEIEMQNWLAQNWQKFIPLFQNAAPLLLLGVLLGLVALYIMPAAILGWLKEDRLGAAFSMKTLRLTATLDYLVNWLIVGYLIGLVNTLLQWIPILGVGISMYVGGVFSYTVFSEIYERGQQSKNNET